jgi:hypothetical protein
MALRMKKWTWLSLGMTALLWSVACGSDKSEAAPPDIAGRAGKGGSEAKAGTGASTSDKAGSGGKAGGSDHAGSGNSVNAGHGAGAGGAAGEAGAAGKDAAASCDGKDGCYSCEPKEQTQYLNQCSDSQCEGFDNEKRLPLYNHGDLPALP